MGSYPFVLIESDWNLKEDWCVDLHSLCSVLIESDWNLKEVSFIDYITLDDVLIESDWNLKDAGEDQHEGNHPY